MPHATYPSVTVKDCEVVVWLERVGRALGYKKPGVLYMSIFADNALLGDQHSFDRYRQGVFLHTHM